MHIPITDGVFLEKLIVGPMFENVPAFYEIGRIRHVLRDSSLGLRCKT
jgi:hypothetical protein